MNRTDKKMFSLAFFSWRLGGSIAVLFAGLLLLSACSDETEAVDDHADAGADVEAPPTAEVPSVDGIDPDGAEPADERRIIVETTETAGVIDEAEPLPAADYLTEDDATGLLGDAELSTQPLAGQRTSAGHNSVRYAPMDDDGERFGVGLQMWDLAELGVDADERLEELRGQFLNVDDVENTDLGEGAFTSRRAGIRTLVFADRDASHLYALSCDTDHCTDYEQMSELAAEILGTNDDGR